MRADDLGDVADGGGAVDGPAQRGAGNFVDEDLGGRGAVVDAADAALDEKGRLASAFGVEGLVEDSLGEGGGEGVVDVAGRLA